MNKSVLAIIAMTVSASVVAQARHELSVKQAVEYAAKNNSQVKNALVDVDIQSQTNREITAMAYPQLNGNIGATYNPNVAVQVFPNFIAALIFSSAIGRSSDLP